MAAHLSKIPMSEIKASNANITVDNAPRTAVFVGATSGIGKATLTRLVAQKTPLKAYVIGRNAAKSQPMVDELRKLNDKAEIIFLQGEVSLLADVKRVCDEIKAKEQSLDLLYLSAGYLPFGGREETSEGLEITLSLAYYSRLLFTVLLLPLLNAAAATSPTAPRVLNILDAGFETAAIPLDDLDLKQPKNFSIGTLTRSAASYITLAMSRLARENPAVVMVHNHPGAVATDVLKQGWGTKWYGKALMTAAAPVMNLVAMSAADAGERCVYLATSARYGGKGVPVKEGAKPATTLKGTAELGDVFCIDFKLVCLRQEKVISELEKMGAPEKFRARLDEVIGPYC